MNIVLISKNKAINKDLLIFHREITSNKVNLFENDRKRLVFESSFSEVVIPQGNLSSLSAFSLIYVYADTQCGKCITEDIALIRMYFKGSYAHFFPVLEDTRSNYAVLNSDLYDMSYTRLNKGTVVFPQVDGKAVRFMGIIDSKGEIVSAFYPSIASEEQKVQYLNFVKERYHL